MECLFKTYSKTTLEEYKRFNYTIVFKHLKLFVILFELFTLGTAIICRDIVWLILAVLYLLFVYVSTSHSAKKIYKTNKIIQNCEAEFEFYGNYFTESTKISTEKIEYGMLHKIVESKTNFYLMIAKNQGYILIKENFPEGLEDFLRSKRDELNLK